jgi:hypothetical protein
MSSICNTRPTVNAGQGANATDASLYLENEHYTEAGSAYFGQAFAEALNLSSDIELHNPEGAWLRLQSIASLLDYALRQYHASMEFGCKSGLIAHHERKLRAAGLNSKGVCNVLAAAYNRGFSMQTDEQIDRFSIAFEQKGYSGLMDLYMGEVQNIYDLITATTKDSEKRDSDSVAWQELVWKLTTSFAQTLEIGKAIAIINTFTFRLSSDVIVSAVSRNESANLNI